MKPGRLEVCELGPVRGHEQDGVRPVLVVSSPEFERVPDLVLAVPLTTADRGLRHHVAIEPDSQNGLCRRSFVMCEQPRVLSVGRLRQSLGLVEDEPLSQVLGFVHRFFAQPYGLGR